MINPGTLNRIPVFTPIPSVSIEERMAQLILMEHQLSVMKQQKDWPSREWQPLCHAHSHINWLLDALKERAE